MSEFHDLSEIALNSEGKAWGNLGYWKHQSEYSAACEALAVLLGDAVQLDEKSIVLDAGFGCGDQLLLWLERYKVKSVRGMNFSRSQTRFARRCLRDAGRSADAEALKYGSVDDEALWDFGTEQGTPNRVIALDCVYHFPSRERFFANAAARLQAGGRIGLTDFLLTGEQQPGSIHRRILSVMLRLSRIPAGNIVNEQQYRDQLLQTGFDRADIVDISADVMPAFASWYAKYRQQGNTKKLSSRDRLKYRITARFLKWAYRKSLLRYCVISAVKS